MLLTELFSILSKDLVWFHTCSDDDNLTSQCVALMPLKHQSRERRFLPGKKKSVACFNDLFSCVFLGQMYIFLLKVLMQVNDQNNSEVHIPASHSVWQWLTRWCCVSSVCRSCHREPSLQSLSLALSLFYSGLVFEHIPGWRRGALMSTLSPGLSC